MSRSNTSFDIPALAQSSRSVFSEWATSSKNFSGSMYTSFCDRPVDCLTIGDYVSWREGRLVLERNKKIVSDTELNDSDFAC
jgi:hypothetical protein